MTYHISIYVRPCAFYAKALSRQSGQYTPALLHPRGPGKILSLWVEGRNRGEKGVRTPEPPNMNRHAHTCHGLTPRHSLTQSGRNMTQQRRGGTAQGNTAKRTHTRRGMRCLHDGPRCLAPSPLIPSHLLNNADTPFPRPCKPSLWAPPQYLGGSG